MSGLFINKNGVLTPIIFYKKTSTGQVQCPVFKKTKDGIERIDKVPEESGVDIPVVPEQVTKVIKGYAQWCGSYRNTSSSGVFKDNFGDSRSNHIYQGKYGSYYYLGIMCFKDIFEQVRALNGVVTDVKLTLSNLHSYSSAGLSTKVCGAFNMPSTRPSSFDFSNVKSTSYCGEQHFNKGQKRVLILDETARNNIQSGNITGFRMLSSTGFNTTNYGYFDGEGSNRPYIEITVVCNN